MEIFIMLHNIRSSYNIGSFFRTSDGANIDKIILSGYSPTPKTNLMGISKTSLGAENTVEWEYIKNPKQYLLKMKEEGYKIISIEKDKKSIDYRKIKYNKKDKLIVIFGNEITGIDKSLLEISDKIYSISMRGKKNSLNVSVAGGIILYKLTKDYD